MTKGNPRTALALAALTYAQDQLVGTRSSAVDDIEPALNYYVAMGETMIYFVRACPMRLDTAAQKKVVTVFDITIGDLINRRLMGWLGETERRDFVLGCAEYLGAKAAEIARQTSSGDITEAVLDAAGCAMVHEKQHSCPLEAHAEEAGPLGSKCLTLLSLLRCVTDAPASLHEA